MSAFLPSLGTALERVFNFRELLPGQREGIDAILSGRDALVVLPTGGGKSLIYQLAALLLSGTAIVVSPLIALMRDQVEGLRAIDYPGAAMLHSQLPESEQRATLEALRSGRLRLLYVTPERCSDAGFQEAARKTQVSLLAVDEAHCISEWGHDFRPSYLLLGDAARSLGRPPVLALTATATPWVRDEIVQRLDLQQSRIIVRGFDRPNLFYEVFEASDERNKRRLLGRAFWDAAAGYGSPIGEELTQTGQGQGIIYTARTASARGLSQWLNRHGVLAAYYHGQLKSSQRNAVQSRFSGGDMRVIAATNAFGMGIDLPALRFVAHYDPPPSLEAYYQESGRAGRDGELARCTLLYRPEDFGRAAFASGASTLPATAVEQIREVLGRAPAGGMTRTAVIQETGLSSAHAVRGLELLISIDGALERRGRFRPRAVDPERLRQALELEERRQEHDRSRAEMVRAYVQAAGCRRQFLLQYFGDYDAPSQCGRCDRCLPRRDAPEHIRVQHLAPAPPTNPFAPGDAVEHSAWGRGTVQHVTDEQITAHFDTAGYRTLDLRTVLAEALLRPLDREAAGE